MGVRSESELGAAAASELCLSRVITVWWVASKKNSGIITWPHRRNSPGFISRESLKGILRKRGLKDGAAESQERDFQAREECDRGHEGGQASTTQAVPTCVALGACGVMEHVCVMWGGGRLTKLAGAGTPAPPAAPHSPEIEMFAWTLEKLGTDRRSAGTLTQKLVPAGGIVRGWPPGIRLPWHITHLSASPTVRRTTLSAGYVGIRAWRRQSSEHGRCWDLSWVSGVCSLTPWISVSSFAPPWPLRVAIEMKPEMQMAILYPWWLRWWRICLQCWGPGYDPWEGKIPWRRKWQPTPVFLPGKFSGQKSLAGYSPWGRQESDTSEQLTLKRGKAELMEPCSGVSWDIFSCTSCCDAVPITRVQAGLSTLPPRSLFYDSFKCQGGSFIWLEWFLNGKYESIGLSTLMQH